MRLRLPFAGAFLFLLFIAAYAGLTKVQLGHIVNDKVLHVVTFFLLTIIFYWIVDTNRRRILNMTLAVCTFGLGVGSEFVQSFLPNDRDFDMYDIVGNIVGSLAGLGLCSWYHKRMLERRRQQKTYNAVPGEDEEDVELGEGHETGVMDGPSQSLEDEVDNWDENAIDNWDDEDPIDDATGSQPVKVTEEDAAAAKKRTD